MSTHGESSSCRSECFSVPLCSLRICQKFRKHHSPKPVALFDRENAKVLLVSGEPSRRCLFGNEEMHVATEGLQHMVGSFGIFSSEVGHCNGQDSARWPNLLYFRGRYRQPHESTGSSATEHCPLHCSALTSGVTRLSTVFLPTGFVTRPLIGQVGTSPPCGSTQQCDISFLPPENSLYAYYGP